MSSWFDLNVNIFPLNNRKTYFFPQFPHLPHIFTQFTHKTRHWEIADEQITVRSTMNCLYVFALFVFERKTFASVFFLLNSAYSADMLDFGFESQFLCCTERKTKWLTPICVYYSCLFRWYANTTVCCLSQHFFPFCN